MGKHAYCIVTHTDRYCLKKLIDLIDYPKNDIFILKDKKSSDELTKGINCKFSEIYFLKDELSINWGGQSQMIAELKLIENAINKDTYDYIHILSGVDLPLKTQSNIHKNFDKLPKGSNVIGFSKGEENLKDLDDKTSYYHIFGEFYKNKNKFIRYNLKIIRSLFLRLQKFFKIKRNWNLELKKGSNWVSLSNDFSVYLIKNKDKFIKLFKLIPCVDEIFLHTIIWNSQFKNTLINLDELPFYSRKIDWKRGSPYIWRINDKEELLNCPQFLARKFDSNIDKDIIDSIYNTLKNI